MEDANHRKAESNSNSIINGYKDQVNTLRGSTQQKDHVIDKLREELDELNRKYGLLENDNALVRAALLHVRNNPEELVRQVKKKGGGSLKKIKSKKRSNETNDENKQEVVDAVAGMITAGKEAVKLVYRTFKFISNNKQERMFTEMMLDNLGHPDLLLLPGDTDERKAQVAQRRKETVDEYGAFWISELNVHRTYVQVSAQNIKITDLNDKILTCQSHFPTFNI